MSTNTQKQQPVKIRVVETKPKQLPKTDDGRIIETPMAPTEKPDSAKFLGAQDHIAEKETKVSSKVTRPKAADAGQKGNPEADKSSQQQKRKAENELKKDSQTKEPTKIITSTDGKVVVADRKPRNKYESMLPQSNELHGQLNAGFQDHIDEDIPEGDRIDLNTTEYKYISYNIKLRKAIELVWIYPQPAVQRGMQGTVVAEWIIMKDGGTRRVRILQSSGHEILDQAVVKAIKDAAPFPSLPAAWKSDKKVFTGRFTYQLTSFAGAH
jgi:protein TonB